MSLELLCRFHFTGSAENWLLPSGKVKYKHFCRLNNGKKSRDHGELDHAITVMPHSVNIKRSFTKIILSIAIYLYKCFFYLLGRVTLLQH